MKVYFGLDEFQKGKKIVATIGTFDGVHIGHKKLLKDLISHSEKEKGESLLLTFYPHPRMVLFPENNDLKLLNTQEEKIELLDELGIDHLIIHPFTRDFSRLSSTEFIRDILVNTIGVHKLVIGYDHHFGRNREGSYSSLTELSQLYGFGLEEISAEEINDIDISSTKIREALNEGDIDTANTYLDNNYSITGKVVEGNQLGRTIGFPTANIQLDSKYKLVPLAGVYAVNVNYNDTEYKGMLNIGNRPTVNSTQEVSIEVHIFDFNESIYNEQLTLTFVKRIRDEKKFSNTEELANQLNIDQTNCINILR
ncbi:MAG: bifunctional riboflavin kinase/FAD synthetase [Salibacteraceae bacterium]